MTRALRIVMADDSMAYDGRDLQLRPLGGAESAFILLAESLAVRGHTVIALTPCAAEVHHNGVIWRPLAQGDHAPSDIVIANRAPKHFARLGPARRRVLWLHGPAPYLRKWRNLKFILRYRPVIVTLGPYHAATVPHWLPGRRAIIPHAVGPEFIGMTPSDTPPAPRAIFTSNPERGLDWLLNLWVTKIHPAVPRAELHIFSGAVTYSGQRAQRMQPVLDFAATLSARGVVMRAPVPKAQLAAELAQARVMLYRGDAGETFCFAAAEAQALGVPLVTAGIGSLAERVDDGVTGFCDRTDDAFVSHAIQLLTDDALWQRQHAACLAARNLWTWDNVAAGFERL